MPFSFLIGKGNFVFRVCAHYTDNPLAQLTYFGLSDSECEMEAFSSVCCLYCEKEAIILSPAGVMSKSQLCTVLSNLLSLLLIIFLLASTLRGEANNTVFLLQRLCACIKWCWDNPSLRVPFCCSSALTVSLQFLQKYRWPGKWMQQERKLI